MKYGFVSGIDSPISRLVQGTVPISMREIDSAYSLLDTVVAQGGNAFDTAHVYSGGDSERAFGQWIKARNNRDKVIILSKGAHHNQDRHRVTPFDILSDVHDSLARIQVDYLDIYLLHRDDLAVPVGPIVEVLNQLKAEGKIRAFGGSNWGHGRIFEANEYAAKNGLTPFAVSSPNFSLADQVRPPWDNCLSISGPSKSDARDWYHANNTPLFCWSSLAGGFFSGRITRANQREWDDYFMKLAVECYASDANFDRLDRVTELAATKGLSIPQLALAWFMHQSLNLFALVGCSDGVEFAANAASLEIELSVEELKWLNLEN